MKSLVCCIHVCILNWWHLLSNQEVSHKHSRDGGEGQGQRGGAGRRVAQVCVAARLGHLVDGLVCAKVHIFSLVAVRYCQATLHLDVHKSNCGTTNSVSVYHSGCSQILQSLSYVSKSLESEPSSVCRRTKNYKRDAATVCEVCS